MKCILHIGTEKTGTTVIQDWLYLNQRALSDAGIALSDVIGRNNNRDLVAFVHEFDVEYFRDRQITDPAAKEAYFEGFEQRFLQDVESKAAGHDVFVITSEHFHSRIRSMEAINPLRELLYRCFDEVKVVCYFREQTSVRRSLYSTALRLGATVGLNQFQPKIYAGSDYYNYFKMLNRWEEVFGIANIEAALYDKDRFAFGDIRKDFILRADADIDLNALRFPEMSVNRELSLIQSEIIRAINSELPRYHSDGSVNYERFKFVELIEKSNSLRIGQLHDERSAEIAELFKPSNRRFFRKYFGDGETFARKPNETAPAKHGLAFQLENRPFLRKIIAAVAAFIVSNEQYRLDTDDARRLQDIARKHDTGESLSAEDAALLRQIAGKIGPDDSTT